MILDVIADEIMRRLKRRFPESGVILAVRGRRRRRSEPVPAPVPSQRRSGRPRKSVLLGPRGHDKP
ncbi:hypothetical protein [Rhodoplanes roseus]|uniref:hypothetical protein n=1 Tax=Rhodoplanes roseus TaxID=29409 RepID=UPI0011B55D35|nr:hypothetical protein [Rhodoplanes roseus]